MADSRYANIISEDLTVTAASDALVHVDYQRVQADGVDMGGQLWFARDNAAWLADEVAKCVASHAYADVEETRGDDLLVVFEGGHDQAPYLHVQVERATGADKGGIYAISMTKDLGRKLVEGLRGL
ncbi:MAG: hypothetical protein CVU56_10950 [Deltaproteobacteria bacterium HGW-Deltaproteobacteria-14]|jgi:hypothetical protein|nr:MAG: hypothetical protein CVU56_10950 [Deltaproteobacteria bacterium HGW-Deltaproteobacteria-14]